MKLLLIFLSFQCLTFSQSPIEIFSNKDEWVEKTLSSLTLEEKAAQLVYPHAYGQYMSYDSPDYKRLEHLVKNVKVGGIIFFLSQIYDQAIITNKLQQAAEIPLLISSDFERGVAQRAENATLFPYNMGIGAADDTALTYEMGKIIAAEGRAIGVHQNFAPVSDVNNNPYNPIINVRAFGEDVKLVERLSNAFLKGVQDGGMIATSKHFPGHGNTNVDSHRGLPLIEGSKNDLSELELYPFKSNVKAGVMSFMVGHLEVPAFEPAAKLPSTLSRKIVTDLLKDELGFKGLIVTDAMNMKAITNSYSTGKAAVEALKAGNDMILFPDDAEEAVIAIINAVKENEIKEERIDESVRKILAAKKWAGLSTEKLIDIDKISQKVGIENHWKTAKELARKSITLVKDESKIIPLNSSSEKKYTHISVLDSRAPGADSYFNKQLLRRNGSINTKTLLINSSELEYKEALDAAENSDAVIVSVYLKVRAYEGDLGLTKNQQELIKKLIKLNKPMILLSHGNPYILAAVPDVKTYLCNYGDTEVSELALAEALFGEIDIQGKLPISIPESNHKAGAGISIKKSALRKQAGENNFFAVDSLIYSSIKDSAFPGAVVLTAKNGEIIHHKAYGRHTYDPLSSRVDVKTIFDLASVSKVVGTTTAAMLCVDRGLFSLSDKVSGFIPEFSKNGKENITIENLLVHNSGLVPFKRYYEMFDNEVDVLNDIYSSELAFETGTEMKYSDLGLIVLGKIIEKVTSKSLDVFLHDEIFFPLGMDRTFYNPSEESKKNIAPTEFDNHWRNRLLIGEVHDENAALLNGVAGHAGLFSTAENLAVYLQMILQKGFYQGKQFIKKETVELFTKKHSGLSSRALGWDTKSPKNSSAGNLFSSSSFGHTGYTGTSIWVDPERELFVIFLTNRVYPTRENWKITSIRPQLHDAVIRSVEK